MIRIYFHFYLFKSIFPLALVHALCFSVINEQKTQKKIRFLYVCLFFSSLIRFFYFVRAFYFYICYEVSSRQNCRSVYYWNFFVFHRLKKKTNKHINDELLYLCFHNNRIKFINISTAAFFLFFCLFTE